MSSISSPISKTSCITSMWRMIITRLRKSASCLNLCLGRSKKCKVFACASCLSTMGHLARKIPRANLQRSKSQSGTPHVSPPQSRWQFAKLIKWWCRCRTTWSRFWPNWLAKCATKSGAVTTWWSIWTRTQMVKLPLRNSTASARARASPKASPKKTSHAYICTWMQTKTASFQSRKSRFWLTLRPWRTTSSSSPHSQQSSSLICVRKSKRCSTLWTRTLMVTCALKNWS